MKPKFFNTFKMDLDDQTFKNLEKTLKKPRCFNIFSAENERKSFKHLGFSKRLRFPAQEAPRDSKRPQKIPSNAKQ